MNNYISINNTCTSNVLPINVAYMKTVSLTQTYPLYVLEKKKKNVYMTYFNAQFRN
jgi:hypothetical protein